MKTVKPKFRNSHHIYQDIKESIIKLEIPPGAKIDETLLQEKYNTSRTPIRECLQRLVYDKLIYIVPRKGTFVTQVDIKEFKHIFEVKVVLEGLAGDLVIKRAGDFEKKTIYELLTNTRSLLEKGDYNELISLDQEFHKKIREFSRNTELEEILDNYNLKATRFWYYTLDEVPEMEGFLKDFEEFYRCMENKDSEKGKKILSDHVIRFVEYIKYKLL